MYVCMSVREYVCMWGDINQTELERALVGVKGMVCVCLYVCMYVCAVI